jgi:S1-C subfamily serine protease
MLRDSYKKVKDSIVAIIRNYETTYSPDDKLPPFPTIIGTGYLVHPDGIVATNRHVLEAVEKLKHPGGDKWGASCVLLSMHEAGQAELHFEIIGCFKVTVEHGHNYYGDPKGPDIAFFHIKGKELPFLEYDSDFIPDEGTEVATAGYPMGTDALMAPGWLHQISPTLNTGIISAVHPFACPTPHGFSINTLTQGGASGSPVFLPETGKVIGTLYAGLNDLQIHPKFGPYLVPAGHSHIVPAHYSVKFLNVLRGSRPYEIPSDAKSIAEIFNGWDGKTVFDRENGRWKEIKE